MTIDDQIKDEKLQYDINREAAKISALSSGNINNYECLTGEEILLFSQKQIIEQAKFTYSSLGKAFDKQIKTTQHQGKKQVDALKDSKLEGQTKSIEGIFPKDDENGEIKNELHKIKRYEKNLLEITCFMNRVSRYMILKCLKQ